MRLTTLAAGCVAVSTLAWVAHSADTPGWIIELQEFDSVTGNALAKPVNLAWDDLDDKARANVLDEWRKNRHDQIVKTLPSSYGSLDACRNALIGEYGPVPPIRHDELHEHGFFYQPWCRKRGSRERWDVSRGAVGQ